MRHTLILTVDISDMLSPPKHRMSNVAIDKKKNNKTKTKKLSGPHDPKCVSHRFHDHECILHVLALLNSIMESFQLVQESWHHYIDIIYFFGTFERHD